MVFQKLHAWQAEHGYSDARLAAELDLHQTAISRAKRGERVLGMKHQLALQDITKTISPADWAEFYAQTIDRRPSKKRGGGGKKAGGPFVESPVKSEAA